MDGSWTPRYATASLESPGSPVDRVFKRPWVHDRQQVRRVRRRDGPSAARYPLLATRTRLPVSRIVTGASLPGSPQISRTRRIATNVHGLRRQASLSYPSRLRCHAGRPSTEMPGGKRRLPFGQGPAYQQGHPSDGGGHPCGSGGSSRRGISTVADQPGLVIEVLGSQAATGSSNDSPSDLRMRCGQAHKPHQPCGARPHVSNRAECGGRSMCTAIESCRVSTPALEHLFAHPADAADCRSLTRTG
jgi:hypothetical protein